MQNQSYLEYQAGELSRDNEPLNWYEATSISLQVWDRLS